MTGRAPTIYIGCAGWSIASAHAALAPGKGTHLERYARVFNAVEINSSFYRPHRAQTYAKWADSVPDDFRFAVKMPKTISHRKRLRECGEELQAFFDQVDGLGTKLGVLLLQLPPSLAFDATVALPFFDRVRGSYGGAFACEPRHPSWFAPGVDAALRVRNVTRAAADPARVPRAAVAGGDRQVEYVRLHGAPRIYYDAYSSAILERVAKRMTRRARATRERWCIFDNTALGHAMTDALQLRALVASAAGGAV